MKPPRDGHLWIAEVFGPTIQGEGPSLGRRASFVRLGGCNLTCSWCDTPYTWDWEGVNGQAFDPVVELREVPVLDVWRRVADIGAALTVITGGEPMLQQPGLAALARELQETGINVEVETNGTILPRAETLEVVDRFNVSPKLANAGMPMGKRLKGNALEALRDSGKAVFKFVAGSLDDLAEINTLVIGLGLDRRTVWVMPLGAVPGSVNASLQEIAGDTIERGFNLTTRLHVQLWGGIRGV